MPPQLLLLKLLWHAAAADGQRPPPTDEHSVSQVTPHMYMLVDVVNGEERECNKPSI